MAVFNYLWLRPRQLNNIIMHALRMHYNQPWLVLQRFYLIIISIPQMTVGITTNYNMVITIVHKFQYSYLYLLQKLFKICNEQFPLLLNTVV